MKSDRHRAEEILIKRAVESGIADGYLELDGLSVDERSEAIAEYLLELAQAPELCVKVDHQPALLRRARDAVNSEDYEFAALMYAIWAEHWLNGLIDTYATRRGMTNAETIDIIRDTPLRGKVGWLLKLLGAKPLWRPHRNAILGIAGFRNCYAHYKWKPVSIDDDRHRPELIQAVDSFESTVTYLKRYENKHVYSDSKRVAKAYVVESHDREISDAAT